MSGVADGCGFGGWRFRLNNRIVYPADYYSL